MNTRYLSKPGEPKNGYPQPSVPYSRLRRLAANMAYRPRTKEGLSGAIGIREWPGKQGVIEK